MIKENGNWTVNSSAYDSAVYLFSHDCEYDVTLRVEGDFKDLDQKLEYAQEIARRLNLWKEAP